MEVNMKITKDIRDLCFFMAIGDGYINKKGFLSIRHCEKQKDYIEWKRTLIEKVIAPINKNQIQFSKNGKDGKFSAYNIRTKNFKFLKLYRKILYKPKKVLNRKMLNKLTPLGVFIWYLDDGGLSRRKLLNGTYSIHEIMLNTGFQREENQIIIDYFKEVWEINFSQVKNNSVYRLRCGKIEGEKFLNIFKEYHKEVPSMSYKIDPNSY